MTNAKPSVVQTILEAVKDLHAQEQIVTRETLHEHLGINYGPLDNALSVLVENGDIMRVQRGVYIPRPDTRPNRPMTKTIIPGGWVKIEIGDDYAISLSPAESRALGELTAGAGQQFAAVELGHHAAIMASILNQRLLKLERLSSPLENSLALVARIKALEEEVKRLSERKIFKGKSKRAEADIAGA
ncbi:hypothetical protein LX59_02831 [Azomonas agilis]|uniref:Uncharacterized protein n=1 Tax=Azomonas agilis TaxID=116849 RepID=A0A562HYZ9_9GAMM|nr:hypothetical protein [Azomonas agilis]TWH64007.1 hypothetical protein LX59_02831 [Azomonas agilis]